MTRAPAAQGAPGHGPAGGPAVSSLARWAPRTNRVPTGSEHRRDGGLSRSDFLPTVGGGYAVACCTRGVAQFGSALRSGRRGRGFKSRHPDDEKTHELAHEVFEEEGVRGRQAVYPDDEKACEFARGPSAVPGPQSPSLTGSALPWWSRSARTERESELVEPRPPSPCTRAGTGPYRGSTAAPGDERAWLRHHDPTGVDQPYGSVSTALTLTDPASMCPAGIVGMLRFRPGVQRRSGVDVSTMDTGTPQSLSSSPLPDRRDSPYVAGVRSRGFSLRSHAHARTARMSGVLHGGRGFVQYAQPTASASRPSDSGSPGRDCRPNALP